MGIKPMMMMQKGFAEDISKILATVTAATVLSFNVVGFSSAATSAADTFDLAYSPTSTIHLADGIKVLDMSLPSYDSLSDAKASVENVKDLAQEYKMPSVASGKGKVKKESNMDKKQKSNTAAKKSVSDSYELQSAPGAKVEIVDMSIPSYDFSTSSKSKSSFSL